MVDAERRRPKWHESEALVARVQRQARRAIDTFGLNLDGLVVLTEAASGWFALTPLIAALAGADSVVALGRDSVSGQHLDNANVILGAAERWGCSRAIHVTDRRDPSVFKTADIVTNLGFVRPLDDVTLSWLKPTAVVALMCEPWEVRTRDVDVMACADKGIVAIGTDETVGSLQTFDYVGVLAMKELLLADVEVLKSQVVVLGGGIFGSSVVEVLARAGARVGWIGGAMSSADESRPEREVRSWDRFAGEGVVEFLAAADALVIVEHDRRDILVGTEAEISFEAIASMNRGLHVVHIAGAVDRADLMRSGLSSNTARPQRAGTMTKTTADVGPRPMIDLHAAGLCVGGVAARARLGGSDVMGAVEAACRFAPGKCR